MAARRHDLLVIGGGILGTAIARDAALRGYSVALVEKEDWGYGTSSRSTRLAHGGLRYLEQWDFGLVREALVERERLVRNATHLVRPQRFLLPVYRGSRVPAWKLRLGLWLYDALGAGGLPRPGWLSREQALAAEPALRKDGLLAAGTYWDARIASVERLCLENALDAAVAGAAVANHAAVEGFLRQGERVVGAVVRDVLTGARHEIRARLVANAAGPWLPELAGVAGVRVPHRRSRGSHLVVPNFLREAVLLRAARDDRVFFAIPLDGSALIGTTDLRDDRSPDLVRCDEEEARYLREEAARYLGFSDEVWYATCGVRLLVDEPGKTEGQLSRRHEIRDHADDGAPGLWSVLGGKITTMRQVAEDAVDRASVRLGARGWCETRDRPLPGAASLVRRRLARQGQAAGLSPTTVEHLIGLYGSRSAQLFEACAREAALGAPVCPHAPDVLAQVDVAIREEGALTLQDILVRRLSNGSASCQGEDALARVLARAAALLGWDDKRVGSEEAAYRAFAARRRIPSPGAALPHPGEGPLVSKG